MTRSPYLHWSISGPFRRPSLLSRFMRRLGWFVGVGAVALAFSCTDEDGARGALEGMGMTNIEFHGHGTFECSKDDFSCTEFTATNPQGRKVHGAVGCGVGCGKGCTVRFK